MGLKIFGLLASKIKEYTGHCVLARKRKKISVTEIPTASPIVKVKKKVKDKAENLSVCSSCSKNFRSKKNFRDSRYTTQQNPLMSR